jgi:RimJ/RimL family protein N-acetyltransferase
MEPFQFADRLDGDRIYLKKHDLSLAKTMFEYVDRDRKRLELFLPWTDYIHSAEDEENYIRSTHDKWEQMVLFDYGIFTKDTNRYMGNVGVHTIQWEHNCCELGYWILGDFEGQGFMSESVQVLDKYAFDNGFHRVQIRCSSINERSSAVPTRCGYVHEGTFRENAIERGKYRDTKMFSKLAHESK